MVKTMTKPNPKARDVTAEERADMVVCDAINIARDSHGIKISANLSAAIHDAVTEAITQAEQAAAAQAIEGCAVTLESLMGMAVAGAKSRNLDDGWIESLEGIRQTLAQAIRARSEKGDGDA